MILLDADILVRTTFSVFFLPPFLPLQSLADVVDHAPTCVKGSRYEIAAHALMLERPQRAAELVTQFLQS